MSQTPTIECKPNGPYVVKGLANLSAADGAGIATKPVMALCRCGGSASKPFCDGTHQRNGFSDAKLAGAGAGARTDYRGTSITIHDNRALCAHAGHCTARLAAVFKYGQEPWIDPDGAAATAIVETVKACPSGALSYSLDGVEHRDQAGAPAIAVTRDGPYGVAGGVQLRGAEWGEGASTEHYTLCRCGGSKNKPFCDGTHWSIGFRDGPR
jgi:CDGSH-type Zn-finger protein